MTLRLLGVLVLMASVAQGQSRNLQTCMTGRYPSLCDHAALSPEQRVQVDAAERRENLRVCMTGRYPSLCNHGLLVGQESLAVRSAEVRENLRVCLTGKYPSLCDHDLLSPIEAQQVQSAERSENLKVCLDGRYPALCNHGLLTSEETSAASAAETRAASARPPAQARPRSPRSGSCESGHWIEAVEGDGKIIKLEDGTLWEVDDVDTVQTSIWLATSEVVLCEGKMINTDDNESASVSQISGDGSNGSRSYEIMAAANDETFVINGQVFKAKTYCFGFDKGDRVLFVQGSASGACSSAEFVRVRDGKTCRVWCE
jgi:hypothetical protein